MPNPADTTTRGTSVSTATPVATYQYDANGNRVGKTLADGTKIAYLVDGNMPYAQVASETATSPTGAITETDYLYGLERIALTRAGQGTYYHDDGLGSTRVLTDQTGTVTDSYEYDDYGALQSQTGTTNNSFLYAGEQYDGDAGLYYNRARYLDANTGRFTGLDPYAGRESQPITLNKYAYANSGPIGGNDPSGLMTMSETQVAEKIQSQLTKEAINDVTNFVTEKMSKALVSPMLADFEKYAKAGQFNEGNAGVALLLTALSNLCLRGKKRCYLKGVNTLVNGIESPETSLHILEGLTGRSNGTVNGELRPLPFLLLRGFGRVDVPFRKRRASPPCSQNYTGRECDEYPYASTVEGGTVNYAAGNVSLRLVTAGDNSAHGNVLKWFYAGGKNGKKLPTFMPFINLSVPVEPAFRIDTNGVFHMYPN